MQKRIAKKVSEALRIQGEDDFRLHPPRRNHPIPVLYEQQAPTGPGSNYDYRTQHPGPPLRQPEIRQHSQDEYYYPPNPPRNPPLPISIRLVNDLPSVSIPPNIPRTPQYFDSPNPVPRRDPDWARSRYTQLQDNDLTSNSLNSNSTEDDFSDEVSLDDTSADSEPPIGFALSNDPSYDLDYNDRDRIRMSAPNPRLASREDDQPQQKPKKSSLTTFLPGRKISRTKSISFEDESDMYTESGSGSRSSGSRSTRSGTSGNSDSRSSLSHRRSNNHGSTSNGNRDIQSSSMHLNSSRDRDRDRDHVKGQRKHSSTRMSSSRPHLSPASNSPSREVMALPIEFPESVTDVDDFHRYLARSDSSMESVGSGAGTTYAPKGLGHLGPTIHRRTMALSQAIMTLALLSASASQLRFVVAYSTAQSYPALNYFLICTCIIVEILVGIGYVVLSRFDFTDVFVEKVHSYLIFGLFMVAVANVIIASFALDDHVCESGKGGRSDQFDGIDQSIPQNPP